MMMMMTMMHADDDNDDDYDDDTDYDYEFRLIKHHHKSLRERVSWAQLMCGDQGLVHALIQVILHISLSLSLLSHP